LCHQVSSVWDITVRTFKAFLCPQRCATSTPLRPHAHRSANDFFGGLRFRGVRPVRISGGRMPPLIRLGDHHINAPQYQDADVVISIAQLMQPRIVRAARPDHVDEGYDTVG